MADEHRPNEGNVINLHEVDRYYRDCNFTDRMNELEDLLDDLKSEGIRAFALVSDSKIATRFSTGIDAQVLIKGLAKFFQEAPEIYNLVIAEVLYARIEEREDSNAE